MKGIVLAGGNGKRLMPDSLFKNKHLTSVSSIPIIFFPLRTLKSLGITEIMLVTGGSHVGSFCDMLGDGTQLGLDITYKVQKEASGIAAALGIAKKFVHDDEIFATILGDNFYENVEGTFDSPTVFVKQTASPERFGVLDDINNVIVEKPKIPPTNKAVTGLYIYDNPVFDFIDTLTPSARGELEITDVNNWYLKQKKLKINHIDSWWQDMGETDSKYYLETFLYNSKFSKIITPLNTFLNHMLTGNIKEAFANV